MKEIFLASNFLKKSKPNGDILNWMVLYISAQEKIKYKIHNLSHFTDLR